MSVTLNRHAVTPHFTRCIEQRMLHVNILYKARANHGMFSANDMIQNTTQN